MVSDCQRLTYNADSTEVQRARPLKKLKKARKRLEKKAADAAKLEYVAEKTKKNAVEGRIELLKAVE